MPDEPQITKIAAYIAYRVPTDGVRLADAHQSWRHLLRYARQAGTIEEITEQLAHEAPNDETLKGFCAELRR